MNPLVFECILWVGPIAEWAKNGDQIQGFRIMAQKGLTTRSLADRAGVNPSNLGRLIKGDQTRVDTSTLDARCKRLDCQLGDLHEYVPDKPKRRAKKGRKR